METDMIPTRRSFLTGMLILASAPAIIRASSLMPVKSLETFTFQTDSRHLWNESLWVLQSDGKYHAIHFPIGQYDLWIVGENGPNWAILPRETFPQPIEATT